MYSSIGIGLLLRRFNASLSPTSRMARDLGIVALVITVLWSVAVAVSSQIDYDTHDSSAMAPMTLFYVGVLGIVVVCVGMFVICEYWPVSASSSANDVNPNADVIEIRGAALVVGSRAKEDAWQDLSSGSGAWDVGGLTDGPARPSTEGGAPETPMARALSDLALSLPPLWPIPLLIWPPESGSAGANEIVEAAHELEFNDLSFVLHNVQQAASPVGVVEAVFAMFDRHPGMPALLVSSGHASATNSSLGEAFTPNASLIFFVRPERVDFPIRGNVGAVWTGRNTGTAASLRALFAKSTSVPDMPLSKGRFVKADQWRPVVAAYMSETPWDSFPGRSVHVPVRWTKDQLKVLDEAPRLGRLHRHASTKEVSAELEANAVQQSWKKAIKALPLESGPQRVLMNHVGQFRLRGVLHDILNPGLLGEAAEDKRVVEVGDRGVGPGPGGALATLGLAVEASNHSRDVSAFVELTGANVSIAMISPAK